jgi:hypothetical protein
MRVSEQANVRVPVKRRDLIMTAISLPLWMDAFSNEPAPAASKSERAPRLRSRVRPSDPGWPSMGKWEELKRSVGGNLIKVQPLFAVCGTADLRAFKKRQS